MENIIGNRIRDHRKAMGLSQKQLAKKVGLSYTTVSKWETGIAEPKVFCAICLAQFFGTTVEELFSP